MPRMTRPSTTPIRHADPKPVDVPARVQSSGNESKSRLPAVSRRKSVKIYGRPRTGVPRDRLSYNQASLMFQTADEGNSYKYDRVSRHSNNKNAVLQHFIEHRRALETKATERQQLQATKSYSRKKYDRIRVQGEKNMLSFRRKPTLSKREKKRRQRMEGHEFKRRDHTSLKKYGNSMVSQHPHRETYNSYYSPIKAQQNMDMNIVVITLIANSHHRTKRTNRIQMSNHQVGGNWFVQSLFQHLFGTNLKHHPRFERKAITTS